MLTLNGAASYTYWMLFPICLFLIGWFRINNPKLKQILLVFPIINFICLLTLLFWELSGFTNEDIKFSVMTVWAATVGICSLTMLLNSYIRLMQKERN
ncbi:hypothetical protein [Bacillus luti]